MVFHEAPQAQVVALRCQASYEGGACIAAEFPGRKKRVRRCAHVVDKALFVKPVRVVLIIPHRNCRAGDILLQVPGNLDSGLEEQNLHHIFVGCQLLQLRVVIKAVK